MTQLHASSLPLSSAPAVTLPHTHQLDVADSHGIIVRRVFVQAPQPGCPVPATGFPVMFVLDANSYFPLAAQLARNLQNRPPPSRGDPLIVVGIGYPTDDLMSPFERTRDYTPAIRPESGWNEIEHGIDYTKWGAGGADSFVSFIADELLPRVRGQWAVDPARTTLCGHSFGGLFTVYASGARPEAFSRFAAISPSLWWDAGAVGPATIDRLRKYFADGGQHRKILIRYGGLEDNIPDPSRGELKRERKMGKRIAAFAQYVVALNVTCDYKIIEGEDHGSVVLPALVEAVRFAQANS